MGSSLPPSGWMAFSLLASAASSLVDCDREGGQRVVSCFPPWKEEEEEDSLDGASVFFFLASAFPSPPHYIPCLRWSRLDVKRTLY
eukprot:m.224860 g.224860  ORF g.224860 m.224860 type:complete len:86 (-) comp17036_c1_seq8:759-1016(-)